MDNLTPQQRHKNMTAIKSNNTSIEIALRKALWSQGIRYRKNYKKLPGKPDIALTKYKIAIFCDSSFWHGYDWENQKNRIGTNRDYWIPKIERNIERDKQITQQLTDLGWFVLRFWDKEIKKDINKCVETILHCIQYIVDDTYGYEEFDINNIKM